MASEKALNQKKEEVKKISRKNERSKINTSNRLQRN